jgi:hypothetical protein
MALALVVISLACCVGIHACASERRGRPSRMDSWGTMRDQAALLHLSTILRLD